MKLPKKNKTYVGVKLIGISNANNSNDLGT